MADETNNDSVQSSDAVSAGAAPIKEKEEEAVEAPIEVAAAEAAPHTDAVPAKFKKIVEEIEIMTVLDLSELVKVFEKKFGVSAAAVAVGGPAASGPAEEAKSTADVELTDAGGTKIAVIKAVKEALGLGLKEAKDLVDGAPSMLKAGMKKEAAEELKKKIEAAGGKITLK